MEKQNFQKELFLLVILKIGMFAITDNNNHDNDKVCKKNVKEKFITLQLEINYHYSI